MTAGPNEAFLHLLTDAAPDPGTRQPPKLLPVPEHTRGFRIRLELSDTSPSIWRLLEVPGDFTLAQLHWVIQAAMGWTDSHLHQFTTSRSRNADRFAPRYPDADDDATDEAGVRVDELVAAEGDKLFYDYDFGDDWSHELKVEAILDQPPSAPKCVAGALACPPEDCGGIPGYEMFAAWVRSGHAQAQLPAFFETPQQAHQWLPPDWHPDRFDVGAANAAIERALAVPIAVVDGLAEVCERFELRRNPILRYLLSLPACHEPATISDDEAAAITEAYRMLLEAIGSGVKLTPAGNLPSAMVRQIAERTGLSQWWGGRVWREDYTHPVADLRYTANVLGLVHVRNGQLRPTRVGTTGLSNPRQLLQHIARRLPAGKSPADQDGGWLTLAVAASGAPVEDWHNGIAELMYMLDWRNAVDMVSVPYVDNPTFLTLHILAGDCHTPGRRVTGVVPAVSSLARMVIRAP